MLKVGDKVLKSYGSFYTLYNFVTIERETATLWITTGGERWKKKNLWVQGYGYSRIYEITPEVQKMYDDWDKERKHTEIWNSIRTIRQRPVHLQVERLQEIFDELTEPKKEE